MRGSARLTSSTWGAQGGYRVGLVPSVYVPRSSPNKTTNRLGDDATAATTRGCVVVGFFAHEFTRTLEVSSLPDIRPRFSLVFCLLQGTD